MRILKWTLVGILTAIIILVFLSHKWTDDRTIWIFLSGFFENVVAELIGLALVLVATIFYVVRYKNKDLEDVATPIAELVAQLRSDGTLTAEGARRSMVCAVKLITPEHVSLKDNNAYGSLELKDEPCVVCNLPTTVKFDKPCEFCGVKRHIWAIKNKPVPKPTPVPNENAN